MVGTLKFKKFNEIRDHELRTGHDMLLGSCYNFAHPDVADVGGALYHGREDTETVVLFLGEFGDVEIHSRGRITLDFNDIMDPACLEVLAQHEWLVDYD